MSETAGPNAGLKRGLGFRDLTLFYVISCLSIRWIASAAAAGPSILVIWVAALVGFFLPLAGCVMELSSRYPQEGGIYVWAREGFGDFIAFLTAWTYWMSNLPYFAGVLYFGAASALFAFGKQAQGLSASPVYYLIFSVAALAVITLLNIRGVNAGKWLNNLGAIATLVPLAALLVFGAICWWRFGSVTRFDSAAMVPHWSLGNAIFWSTVFFAFSGLESGSAMGDEIVNPRRTIPLAIVAGGVLLTVGYIAGTTALLVALPGDAVGGPDGFIHGIALLSEKLHVGWFVAPVALLVALNAVGGAAAYLSSTSRLPFVAGIDRYLPAAFGDIHPKFQTPWVAIGVYGIAGIVVAALSQAGTTVRGAYDVLVAMGLIAFFLPYLALFGAMIRVQSRPAGPEARRVPGGKPVAIALAWIGIASTVATIVLSMFPPDDDPNRPLAVVKIVGGAAALVAAGVVVFWVRRGLAKKKVRLES